ncbi:MAG: LysM peptidoglycan-binding domain-containing protein [Ignavibacteriae bacterium]|nr:LysM peptidoglycan-binding domain-containing protein [Ignavibacteriota bacterium]
MSEIKDKNIGNPISEGSYPADFNKIGSGDEDFRIFINDIVLNDIKAFLSSDKEKELGGVLLGEVYTDFDGRIFIILNEFVIALYTEASITRLTFTHSSWEYMNNKIDKEYPGKKILGWFHSHPGHTVFLSSYDKFIHENFFTQEYNVAYVFDPVNNDDGFFFMKEAGLVKAGCYYVYSNFRTSGLNPEKEKEEYNAEKKTKKNSISLFLIFALSLLVLVLSFFLAVKYNEEKKLKKEISDLSGKIQAQKEENTKLNTKLENIISLLNTEKDTVLSSQYIIKHQIKHGETLRMIASAYLKDEGKYNLLIRHNNLKDENDITVGQEIEIPTEK